MLARRLRARPRQPGTRAASGPALGTLRSLCEVLADGPTDIGTRKRGPELRHRPKGDAESRWWSAARRACRSQGMPTLRKRGHLVRLAALRSPFTRVRVSKGS